MESAIRPNFYEFITTWWDALARTISASGHAAHDSKGAYPSWIEPMDRSAQRLRAEIALNRHGQVYLVLLHESTRLEFHLKDDEMLERRLKEIRLCTVVLLGLDGLLPIA
jgi:hypothetical protein